MNKARSKALLAALVLLALAGTVAIFIGQATPRPLAWPLEVLPVKLGPWHKAQPDKRLDQKTLAVLRPSDYLMRTYVGPGGIPCSVYIAYFDYQQEGRMIHSPLQCLPGGGWTITQKQKIVIDGPFGPQRVNRLILTHQLNRMSVVYWYQGRGRLQDNEYVDRALLAWDSLTKGRNDGALVRLISVAGEQALASQTDLASRLSQALQKLMDEAARKQEGR